MVNPVSLKGFLQGKRTKNYVLSADLRGKLAVDEAQNPRKGTPQEGHIDCE